MLIKKGEPEMRAVPDLFAHRWVRSSVRGALLWVACSSAASAASWRVVGPDGGFVNEVTRTDSAGELLAGTNVGVVRVNDAGGSAEWVFPNGGPSEIRRFVANPANRSEIFASGRDWGARSTDGGTSWSQFEGEVLAVDPAPPGTIYAEWGDLRASSDGGATWRTIHSLEGSYLRYFRLSADSPATIYLVTESTGRKGSLWKSSDLGDSWESGALPSSEQVRCFEVVGTEPETLFVGFYSEIPLWRSTSGGAEWMQVTSGGRPEYIQDMAWSRSDPRQVWAGNGSSLWRSSDSGSSWKRKSSFPVGGLWADPQEAKSVFVASGAALFRSVDGGETFVPYPVTVPKSMKSVAISPGDERVLLAAMYQEGGLVRSIDGGASWGAVPLPGADSDLPRTRNISARGAPGLPIYASSGRSVFRSVDFGATWEFRGELLVLPDVGMERIAPAGPASTHFLYVWERQGKKIFRSTDQGMTWQARGTASGDLQSFLVGSPHDPNEIIFQAINRGAIRSTDGGLSWAAFGSTGFSSDPWAPPEFDARVPGRICWGSKVSIDGGLTWAERFKSYFGLSGISWSSAFSARPGGEVFLAKNGGFRVVNGACPEDLGIGNRNSFDVYDHSTSAEGRRWALATAGGIVLVDDPSAFRYVIPAIASIPGVPPTFFRSEVRVFNPSASRSVEVSARYLCSSTDCAEALARFTVAPLATAIFSDVVADLFARPSTYGALELESDGPIVAASRLATPPPPLPSFGQFVPAISADEATNSFVVAGVRQSAEVDEGFRSNIGVVNLGTDEVDVVVEVQRASGERARVLSVSVRGRSRFQIGGRSLFDGVEIREEAEKFVVNVVGPPGARLMADASVIDNQSQDPIFVPGAPSVVPSTCFEDRIVVPAGASVRGVPPAFFHSDLWLANRAESMVSASLRFCPAQGSCSAWEVVSVPARQSIEIADVVGSLFRLSGVAGAIELIGWSARSLVVGSRLYTPLAPDPTFGQFVPGQRFPAATSRGAIPFLSHSASIARGFRTNIGFHNPNPVPVVVDLAAYDSAGGESGTTAVEIGAGNWLQVNDADLAWRLGWTGDVPACSIKFMTRDGSAVFGYASVVDNQSQDPIFVPASPL